MDDEDDEGFPAAKPLSARAAAVAPKKNGKDKLFKVGHLPIHSFQCIATFLACHHPWRRSCAHRCNQREQ